MALSFFANILRVCQGGRGRHGGSTDIAVVVHQNYCTLIYLAKVQAHSKDFSFLQFLTGLLNSFDPVRGGRVAVAEPLYKGSRGHVGQVAGGQVNLQAHGGRDVPG